MFKPGAIRLCILSLITLAAACNDELPVEVPPGIARLRIVNAAPGYSGVDVIHARATTPLAQNLNFGAFTQSCMPLPADSSHTLTFRRAGTSLASVTFTPAAAERYTLFLTASGETRRAVLLEDDHVATAGLNGIRVINASSGPGDVYVTEPNGQVVASSRVHGNMGVTALGNSQPAYVAADTTRKQVRLFDVDATTGTPRADLTLGGLPASRLVSVVLADPAVAGPSASFVAFPC